MRIRSLAALGVLLLCSASWAQGTATKTWKPKTPASGVTPSPAAPQAAAAQGKGSGRLIDGVRDTGQFLPDTAIIGRVDDKVFRVWDFRDRWFATYPLDRPQSDSVGRAQILSSMADKEVLATLARQVNRPLGFEDRQALRESRQRLLSNVTFARLVRDSCRYTMDEVRHVYEQGSLRLRVQRILGNDPALLERARAEIVSKRLSWPDAVKKYSLARGDGPGGDLGWKQRKFFDPGPALEIFDLPDGGISSVFGAGDDWQLVRVAERRSEPALPFETMLKDNVNEVLSVKLAQRTEQLRAEIRQRIGMKYDTANVVWAAGVFAEAERQSQGTAEERVIDLSGELPEFQPADTGRVLADWQDGRYSLGQFLTAYNHVPVPQRERIGNFIAFRSTLDRFTLEPFMAELAIERGLDRDPIVTAGLARREEQIRVEHLFSDSVESRVSVTRADREKYYQEHLPDFYGIQSVTYAAIVRFTKSGADSVEARLRAGESAAAILRADSIAGFQSGAIRTVTERDQDPYQKPMFEELRPGGTVMIGPDKRGDYMVLQKISHDPGHQLPYAEVANLVDESVQNLTAERLFKEFVARHRSKHRVELHPELLMRIFLTDPENE
jgi:hypothetical protein